MLSLFHAGLGSTHVGGVDFRETRQFGASSGLVEWGSYSITVEWHWNVPRHLRVTRATVATRRLIGSTFRRFLYEDHTQIKLKTIQIIWGIWGRGLIFSANSAWQRYERERVMPAAWVCEWESVFLFQWNYWNSTGWRNKTIMPFESMRQANVPFMTLQHWLFTLFRIKLAQ